MLALDLGVFHRKAHVVGFKEALGWSAVWVALALVLAFVGAKMLIADIHNVPIVVSLAAVSALVFGSILVSLGAAAKRATAPKALSATE